jgi:hypothetical protein
MIGPYELEVEWTTGNGSWAPPGYERDVGGWWTYVAVYHYAKASKLQPDKLVPMLVFERDTPSEETVDFLRAAVEALNREAALKRAG